MPRADAPSLLIVDDEARILSALHRTLRREGYEILTTESAQEAAWPLPDVSGRHRYVELGLAFAAGAILAGATMAWLLA